MFIGKRLFYSIKSPGSDPAFFYTKTNSETE